MSTWLGHDVQISGLEISLAYVLYMNLDVAVKVFFKWDQHLNQYILSKAEISL